MESTQSDADETTAASGRYGTDQAEATTNTRHSRKRWKLASECGECGQPLEEWEAGVCEGCGTLWEQDEYKSFTAKN